MKIQQSGRNTFVNLPKDIRELLGWEKGDTVTVDADKDKDTIIIRRIK